MLNIDNLFKPLAIAAQQSTASVAQTSAATPASAGTQSEFDALLAQVLPPEGQDTLNEEELFAGLVKERLQKVNAQAASTYEALFSQNLSAGFNTSGQFSYEIAASDSLNQLVSNKVLTKDQANSVYAQSFQAAQLDSNSELLSGSLVTFNSDDPSFRSRQDALEKAFEGVTAIEQGSLNVTTRELAAASPYLLALQLKEKEAAANLALKATQEKAAQLEVEKEKTTEALIDTKSDKVLSPTKRRFETESGFVYQPKHIDDGKLRIQLPKGFDGKVGELSILDEQGKLIENGNITKSRKKDRDQYSFSEPGSSYAANLTLKAQFKDGGSVSYKIPDARKRYHSN